MIKEGKWILDKDVDKMWNDCIKRVAKDVLDESKRCRQLTKKAWWWNKEVQIAIRLKRERAIEAHLDVETMLFMEIIKW